MKGFDLYYKYVLVVILKDRKGIAITNTFQKILDEPNRKPNKIYQRNHGYKIMI